MVTTTQKPIICVVTPILQDHRLPLERPALLHSRPPCWPLSSQSEAHPTRNSTSPVEHELPTVTPQAIPYQGIPRQLSIAQRRP